MNKPHDDFTSISDEINSRSFEYQNDLSEDELRSYYPQDGNLLYVQCYMQIFEPDTDPADLNDLNRIVRFCKCRRDAPNFVRKLLGFYIDQTGHDASFPIIESLAYEVHGLNVHKLEVFKARFPVLAKQAERIIYQHYEEELEGKSVSYLSKTNSIKTFIAGRAKSLESPKNTERLYRLFNHNDMRNHLNSIERDRDRDSKKILVKILNTPSEKPKLKIRDESVFDTLIADFPNFEEVINYYKAQFRLLEETDKFRINPILMVGKPGIGKSLFTKALEERLQTTLGYIDLSSASGGWLLNGLNASWQAAKQGKISEVLFKATTMNPIVVLDEIEKTGRQTQHDPQSTLYSLLEENTAKDFVDEFIEQPIDASGVIFIACANSLDGIPEPLLTRLKVFEIPDPTIEERQRIFRKIYQGATDTSSLFSKDFDISLLDGFLEVSLREVKQLINDAVANALLEKSKEELRIMKQKGEVIHIEARHFRALVKNENKKFGF